MPESIRDGLGKGYLAGVNEENRLKVAGVQVSKIHHTNYFHQDAYNMLFDVTPTAAGDCFLYLRNTSTLPIICTGFNILSGTTERIAVNLGITGTVAGGADTPPVNLYAGASNKLSGTYLTGNDITGLTGGSTAAIYAIEAGTNSQFRVFDADYIIPQNQTLSLCATNGAINLVGFVTMWQDHGGV